jgi:hypothetical protein
VIVPRTAFRSETIAEAARVSLSAATASGLYTASQKLCLPSLEASQTRAAIGSATITVRKVVTTPRDKAVAALSLEARTRGGFAAATLLSAGYPVLPPTWRWMRAMTLSRGSKNRFCTLAQPPRPSWSMVKSPGRVGNFFRFRCSTVLTTGR